MSMNVREFVKQRDSISNIVINLSFLYICIYTILLIIFIAYQERYIFKNIFGIFLWNIVFISQ